MPRSVTWTDEMEFTVYKLRHHRVCMKDVALAVGVDVRTLRLFCIARDIPTERRGNHPALGSLGRVRAMMANPSCYPSINVARRLARSHTTTARR